LPCAWVNVRGVPYSPRAKPHAGAWGRNIELSSTLLHSHAGAWERGKELLIVRKDLQTSNS
jgi:hypothetical protein